MASYDFFTQPQGPNVSVSLFGDAAVQGANVGNAVKTPLAAGIEGVLSGIQTGQKIQSNQLSITGQQQENEIRQNQVERLPVANALQDEKLKQDQLANEIGVLDRDIRVATQTERLEYTKEKLNSDAENLKQRRELQQKEDAFLDEYNSAPGIEQRKQILFGGQYDDVFAKNPNLYRQYALSPTMTQYYSPKERSAVEFSFKRATTKNYLDEEAQKAAAKYPALRSDFVSSQESIDIANASGIADRREIPFKADLVQSGARQFDSENLMARGPDKKPLENPRALWNKGRWDVIVGDKKVGEVDDKYKALYENYKSATNQVSGKASRDGLAQLDADEATKAADIKKSEAAKAPADEVPLTEAGKQLEAVAATQVVKPSPQLVSDVPKIRIEDKFGVVNLARAPEAVQTTMNTLGIPLAGDAAKPIIKSTSDWLEKIQESPDSTQVIFAKELIAQQASEYEFDTNPELQKRYTSEDVTKHNKVVKSFSKTGFDASKLTQFEQQLTASIPANLSKGPVTLDISQMEEVTTPRDLFVLNRRKMYQGLLDSLESAFRLRVKNANLKSPIGQSTSAQLQARAR